MQITVNAHKTETGIVPKHEILVVCSTCSDPISDQEAETGACTVCGATWEPKQSVTIHATTVPAAGGKTWGDK